ncbi:hypothetical protein J6590_019338, partial [Homalodisca vitripennis]
MCSTALLRLARQVAGDPTPSAGPEHRDPSPTLRHSALYNCCTVTTAFRKSKYLLLGTERIAPRLRKTSRCTAVHGRVY